MRLDIHELMDPGLRNRSKPLRSEVPPQVRTTGGEMKGSWAANLLRPCIMLQSYGFYQSSSRIQRFRLIAAGARCITAA